MNSFRENENINKYEFVQLGDAFRYGMFQEMPDVLNESPNAEGVYFYASIAYMYLNGFISSSTTVKIYDTIYYNFIREKKIEIIIEDISNYVFRELLDNYHFNNFDSLIKMLNEIEMPEWYFGIGMELVRKSKEGIFLYNDFLYYIAEDNEKLFVKLNINKIDKDSDLDLQDDKIVLGYGYCRIYGWDQKLKRIYLCAKNQDEFYQYYDMISDNFVICPNKLVALGNGIPFIITQDRFFSYVLGDVIHKIKPYKSYEKYVSKKNCFLLTPKGVNNVFFYPYCITYEGQVIPADIEDCRKFVWNELKKICISGRYSYSLLKSEENDKRLRPKELTIKSILRSFKSVIAWSEQCTSKNFIIFESICEMLTNYLDVNDDITQLLYVLYDVNRIISKDSQDFPSEELYWRFKELSISKEKSNSLRVALQLKDYDVVRNIVLGEEKGEEKYMDDNELETGLIGTFEFVENGIKTYTVDKRHGMVIGSQIVAKSDTEKNQGIVSYDCLADKYYVTSENNISWENRIQIVKDFFLSWDKCTFVIQHKEGI